MPFYCINICTDRAKATACFIMNKDGTTTELVVIFLLVKLKEIKFYFTQNALRKKPIEPFILKILTQQHVLFNILCDTTEVQAKEYTVCSLA